MAAKRNITDFFKPFVQAKRKVSEVEDVEPITVDGLFAPSKKEADFPNEYYRSAQCRKLKPIEE